MPQSGARFAAWMLALLLVAVAFRELASRGLSASADAAVFAVAPLPSALVVAVALWYVWRREMQSLATRSCEAPALASSAGRLVDLAVAVFGVAVFVWSRLVDQGSLLLLALAACLLLSSRSGAGDSWNRSRGAIGVLLLGLTIPRPIEDEIVWSLQRATAAWSNTVLNLVGYEFKVAGVVLRDGTHTFQVIDSCCGLTGMLILLLIAAIVRELFSLSVTRSALLFLVTLVIAFVVNVIRVAYVASSPNPEELAGIGGDHTAQGVFVLAIGTAAVYAVGLLCEGRTPTPVEERDDAAADRRSLAQAMKRLRAVLGSPSIARDVGIALDRQKCVFATLVVLVLISFLVPRGAWVATELPPPVDVTFRTDRPRWRQQEAPPDPYFNGLFEAQYHRRFERRGDSSPFNFVDVFVGQGRVQDELASRAFSSKRLYPGPDWNLLRSEVKMIWSLGTETQMSIAAPNAQREHAIQYVWVTGDRGLGIESWRSFWGLDRLPSDAANLEPRIVRLVAYARSGKELRIDEAEQLLEDFIRDHSESIRKLRS